MNQEDDETTSMPPQPLACEAGGGRDADPIALEAARHSRPTHKLKDIKVGDDGIQMLVSTKDHVYDAATVEGGKGAWQVIGAWEEASISALGDMFSERQRVIARQSVEEGGKPAFKSSYGSGQMLGSKGNTN